MKKFGIGITNPKAMFTNLFTTTDANGFTAINAGISNAGFGGSLVLDDGASVKNIGANDMLVKHTNTSHGDDTGFKLATDEELFIECTNLSDLFVKNVTAGQGISYSVYSNWGLIDGI